MIRMGKISTDLPEVFSIAHDYINKKEPMSIAYNGNIVDLLVCS